MQKVTLIEYVDSKPEVFVTLRFIGWMSTGEIIDMMDDPENCRSHISHYVVRHGYLDKVTDITAINCMFNQLPDAYWIVMDGEIDVKTSQLELDWRMSEGI